MTTRTAFLLMVGACASAPTPPPEPDALPLAVAYLGRVPAVEEAPEEAGNGEAPARRLEAPAARTEADEIRGLLSVPGPRLEALRRAAADDASLATFLEAPVERADLEALAWLRSPQVRAARAAVEAARTSYGQSMDLKDLVALYRSFARETHTGVGPERSRRPTGLLAPSPNVDALSGEIVARTVAIAFEDLRRAVRDTVASAQAAHADAARLAASRRVLREDVALYESLLRVLRARLETGQAAQAGVLAFQGRLETLRTELAILDETEAVVRARWNRLLNRPDDAPVSLDVPPAAPVPGAALPAAGDAVALALKEAQEYRSAQAAAERSALAVRLAETMTLPRADLGSSRFERERAGEAGAQRGQVFPEPGRMMPPRFDFGVREAQVAEMRARREAAREERDRVRNGTRTRVREALLALDSARRRWLVHEKEVVPLARRSFASARGAYEGGDLGYLELLDRARKLLAVRLGRIDARRDYAHADAALLRAVGVRGAEGR